MIEKEMIIASERVRVECLPAQGFVIASLHDLASGAEAIWVRSNHDPEPCTRSLGPAGEHSTETFLDRWPGGWFEMFPVVGYPSPDDATLLLHGELVRLPWTVTHHDEHRVEAQVHTIRGPFLVTRSLEVGGSELEIAERIENVGGEPARYLWGHHPCFRRATFAGGRIDVEVGECSVPDPHFDPDAAILETTPSFVWPDAPARNGGEVDVSAVPDEPDGRVDHICLTLAAGGLTVTAPRYGRALRVEFDLGQFPYLLVWENFEAAGGFPFWRDADTFALEWSTNPGRTVPDAEAADAVRTLAAGEALETLIRTTWTDIAGPPAGS
jgi:galactose mutarotase-like enzyme